MGSATRVPNRDATYEGHCRDRGMRDALLLVEDGVGQGTRPPPNVQPTVGELVDIDDLPPSAHESSFFSSMICLRW